MAARFDAEDPPVNIGTFLAAIETDPEVRIHVIGRSFDARPFEAADAGDQTAPGGAREGAPAKEAPNPFAGNPMTAVLIKSTAFTARIDSIIAAKAILTDVDGRGTITDGMLRMDPVTMQYAGGSGRAVLEVDFRDTRRVESKVRLAFNGIQAGRALEGISSASTMIDGRFSFNTDGSFFVAPTVDPLVTLAASGSATSDSGRIILPAFASPLSEAIGLDLSRLERFTFTKWIGNFHIENGRLRTDDWRISSPSGNWAIRGSFGFDGSLDYTATLVIPPRALDGMIDVSKHRDLVELFKDDRGNVVLDFTIGGRAKSPKFTLDRTRIERKAGEKLLDELKKKAKGLFDR
jgi:hypothetical protein